MGDDNKYAGDEQGGETAVTPENKYAGGAGTTTDSATGPAPDSGIPPDNKYAGSEPGGSAGSEPGGSAGSEPGGSGTTTGSATEPTSDPDSGISPANKYAG